MNRFLLGAAFVVMAPTVAVADDPYERLAGVPHLKQQVPAPPGPTWVDVVVITVLTTTGSTTGSSSISTYITTTTSSTR